MEWNHSSRFARYLILDVLQVCSFLNYIVDWRPMDPVLSGVTQTCVTKLEGEVMIYVSLMLIYHVSCISEEHTCIP